MSNINKIRLGCIALAVISLIAMGIELYGKHMANPALFYIFGGVCIVALLGNAIGARIASRQKK